MQVEAWLSAWAKPGLFTYVDGLCARETVKARRVVARACCGRGNGLSVAEAGLLGVRVGGSRPMLGVCWEAWAQHAAAAVHEGESQMGLSCEKKEVGPLGLCRRNGPAGRPVLSCCCWPAWAVG